MKICIILLCTVMLLLGVTAAAEDGLLLQEQGLTLRLVSCEAAQGELTLTIRCDNQEPWDRNLLLFAPCVNGQPASFQFGWPSEELNLPPMEGREFVVTLYPDDPALFPEKASFRLIEGGGITGEAVVQLYPELTATEQATFFWQDQEAPLISPALTMTGHSEAFVLQDAISPEELQKLDYGQMIICLRTVKDGEEQLLPFASVPATVSPDGTATAVYSGNAVLCTAVPGFPLLMREEHTNGCIYQLRDLSLSGTFIFYAPLDLTMSSRAVTGLSTDSFDTGPLHENLPLVLFDTLHLSRPVYRVNPGDGCMTLQEVDVTAHTLPLTGTLSFAIVPAESLGEVVVYFEYFFSDYTDVIHPAVPLETK